MATVNEMKKRLEELENRKKTIAEEIKQAEQNLVSAQAEGSTGDAVLDQLSRLQAVQKTLPGAIVVVKKQLLEALQNEQKAKRQELQEALAGAEGGAAVAFEKFQKAIDAFLAAIAKNPDLQRAFEIAGLRAARLEDFGIRAEFASEKCENTALKEQIISMLSQMAGGQLARQYETPISQLRRELSENPADSFRRVSY